MLLKAGVKLDDVASQMWFAAGVAEAVYRRFAGRSVMVTSANDSEHKPTSLHYPKNTLDGKCRALDLRTRDLSARQKKQVHRRLWAVLFPCGFDVVLEPDHIHVEFDPKAGRHLPGLGPVAGGV